MSSSSSQQSQSEGEGQGARSAPPSTAVLDGVHDAAAGDSALDLVDASGGPLVASAALHSIAEQRQHDDDSDNDNDSDASDSDSDDNVPLHRRTALDHDEASISGDESSVDEDEDDEFAGAFHDAANVKVMTGYDAFDGVVDSEFSSAAAIGTGAAAAGSSLATLPGDPQRLSLSLSGAFSSQASVPLHLSQLERARQHAQHRRDRSHFSIPDVTVTPAEDDDGGSDGPSGTRWEHKVPPANRRSAIPPRRSAGGIADQLGKKRSLLKSAAAALNGPKSSLEQARARSSLPGSCLVNGHGHGSSNSVAANDGDRHDDYDDYDVEDEDDYDDTDTETVEDTEDYTGGRDSSSMDRAMSPVPAASATAAASAQSGKKGKGFFGGAGKSARSKQQRQSAPQRPLISFDPSDPAAHAAHRPSVDAQQILPSPNGSASAPPEAIATSASSASVSGMVTSDSSPSSLGRSVASLSLSRASKVLTSPRNSIGSSGSGGGGASVVGSGSKKNRKSALDIFGLGKKDQKTRKEQGGLGCGKEQVSHKNLVESSGAGSSNVAGAVTPTQASPRPTVGAMVPSNSSSTIGSDREADAAPPRSRSASIHSGSSSSSTGVATISISGMPLPPAELPRINVVPLRRASDTLDSPSSPVAQSFTSVSSSASSLASPQLRKAVKKEAKAKLKAEQALVKELEKIDKMVRAHDAKAAKAAEKQRLEEEKRCRKRAKKAGKKGSSPLGTSDVDDVSLTASSVSSVSTVPKAISPPLPAPASLEASGVVDGKPAKKPARSFSLFRARRPKASGVNSGTSALTRRPSAVKRAQDNASSSGSATPHAAVAPNFGATQTPAAEEGTPPPQIDFRPATPGLSWSAWDRIPTPSAVPGDNDDDDEPVAPLGPIVPVENAVKPVQRQSSVKRALAKMDAEEERLRKQRNSIRRAGSLQNKQRPESVKARESLPNGTPAAPEASQKDAEDPAWVEDKAAQEGEGSETETAGGPEQEKLDAETAHEMANLAGPVFAMTVTAPDSPPRPREPRPGAVSSQKPRNKDQPIVEETPSPHQSSSGAPTVLYSSSDANIGKPLTAAKQPQQQPAAKPSTSKMPPRRRNPDQQKLDQFVFPRQPNTAPVRST
ncbi:hypothetical protein K437DRAFT_129766 [Tilletiaria anomala UBC 951]|uniref:Uncharacterized protein n=1 Tax=Tilletiaria anomala (strain ATCC 24038 / CBS 436.72 / UBC 951) TaxID=1037660 RepID=A0A066VWS9_TILAU|nr:uncharacterized protein K437DRAFT_129766 [Tilletiaria anomala UBC 951]KDN44743.1 hypothetical protein K437DRAFT_129766 [Tilletiaria anomala UBC 951]